MTTNETPQLPDAFATMLGAAPEPEDGYLRYWREMATEGGTPEEDRRVDTILRGLTAVALRGANQEAEYTDREPSLQARYWYRTLGPLNTLQGAEADLITATGLMSRYAEIPSATERANTRLDYMYALTDVVRVTNNERTRIGALQLLGQEVTTRMAEPDFETSPAAEKLRLTILKSDFEDMVLRVKNFGTVHPVNGVSANEYRTFEKAYGHKQMRDLETFDSLVRNGITEENFGQLFEFYYILSRRFEAFGEEEPESIVVRGATSREDAEWTGEDTVNTARIRGNHDVVVESLDRRNNTHTARVQLKTVAYQGTAYHRDVHVLDFSDVSNDNFRNIDAATARLIHNVRKMHGTYSATLA